MRAPKMATSSKDATEPNFEIGYRVFHNEPVLYMRYNARTVYIIGTRHTDHRYTTVVGKAIRKLHPDLVGVELCRTRIGYKNVIAQRMSEYKEFHFEQIPKEKRMAAIGEKLRLLYVYGAIQYQRSDGFRKVLAKYRKMKTYRMSRAIKMDQVSIGGEIYVPFRNLTWRADSKLGEQYLRNSYTPYSILLMDRPIEHTYHHIARVLSEEEKELVETYKKEFPSYFQNGYGILMASLWEKNPHLKKIFLHHRDVHIAKMIFTALNNHQYTKIISIMGKSHVDGVVKQLITLFANVGPSRWSNTNTAEKKRVRHVTRAMRVGLGVHRSRRRHRSKHNSRGGAGGRSTSRKDTARSKSKPPFGRLNFNETNDDDDIEVSRNYQKRKL